jgi:predicted transcriptional regulator
MGNNNMGKKSINVGIMSKEKYMERTIKIAKGEYKPKKDEPKIWFESIKAMAQTLSQENMYLLKTIFEMKPDSIAELAEKTGRHKSNVSRTLKNMEKYGIVKLHRQDNKVRPVVVSTDFKLVDYGIHSVT